MRRASASLRIGGGSYGPKSKTGSAPPSAAARRAVPGLAAIRTGVLRRTAAFAVDAQAIAAAGRADALLARRAFVRRQLDERIPDQLMHFSPRSR